MYKRNYYQEAMRMAEYIKQGHNQKETASEFGVSIGTVRSRIKLLSTDNTKEYQKVMMVLNKNDGYEDVIV